MGLLDAVKGLFDKPASEQLEAPVTTALTVPEPIKVVELDAMELMVERQNGKPPLLLDCREPFEWKQVRIPGSLHIPMNEIPYRLAELDRETDIVVVCAHGIRSYAVAGFLAEKGFAARSLKGGVATWQSRGGEVENDHGEMK
jgi:rhodanese-related sulfurtransferase